MITVLDTVLTENIVKYILSTVSFSFVDFLRKVLQVELSSPRLTGRARSSVVELQVWSTDQQHGHSWELVAKA